jgi:HPt (histidine-containing phosphotransfer) domain-containing protein
MREAGAEEAVDGILDMFAQNAPERIADLRTAVTAGDAPAIATAAHAFKSPSGAIGALRLAGFLQEIELAARDGALDDVRTAFERAEQETEAVLAHLRTVRDGSLLIVGVGHG